MAEKKSPLHWFPVGANDYLGDPEIARMRPEQEGAFFRLRALAWGDGSKEPSLPADPESLAFMSRLGERWSKLGGIIRDQLTEREGRLYKPEWTQLWIEQQKKHADVVAKGSKGGKTKAENARKRSSPASSPARKGSSSASSPALAQGVADVYQSESEGTLDPHTTGGLAVPALGGARAPEVARAAVAPEAIDLQYELAIGAKVEEYRAAHPEEAAALETDVRAELRVSRNRMLTREEELAVHRRMLERIDRPDLRVVQGGQP